jgi:hypothetical protein
MNWIPILNLLLKIAYIVINSRVFFVIVVVLIITASTLGITYAAFMDKISFDGATVQVGSSNIQLLDNLALPPTTDNRVDTKPVPNFTLINPHYIKDYLVKIYADSSSRIALGSKSNYTTAEDPDDIRRYLLVEIFEWNDINSNGLAEQEELGQSFGTKSIIEWKTEGFNLGELAPGQVNGYLMRFSSPNITNEKQNKTGKFSFEFSAVSLQ